MNPHHSSRRPYRVCFRVSVDERRHLDATAKRSGRSLSDYSRAALLAVKPFRKARVPAVEAVLLARTLAKLGLVAASLNEISCAVRNVKAELTLMPVVERDLSSQLSALSTCRSEIMRALGRKPSPK